MKKYFNPYYLVIFLTFLIATNNCFPQSLFKIYEQGKIGFIDSTGRVVIKPKFAATGEFSEGLAPARLKGYYGFIDTTGEYIIQPQFDFATEFHEGFAIVYIDAKAFFINKSGNKPFPLIAKELMDFKNGRALVENFSKNFGVIDTNGKLILDTIFQVIRYYYDNVMVVYGNDYTFDNSKNVGVVNKNGDFIVPFDIYNDIVEFYDGFSVVRIFSNNNKSYDETRKGIINKNGQLIYQIDDSSKNYLDYRFYNGVIRMFIQKNWVTDENYNSVNNKYYVGLLDTNGQLIFADTNYSFYSNISFNRMFVKFSENKYSYLLSDKWGRKVSENKYKYPEGFNYPNGSFINGFAFVEDSLGYKIIDTLGNIVSEFNSKYTFEYWEELFKQGFIKYYLKYPKFMDEHGQGLLNIFGNKVSEPMFGFFDHKFRNGLLKFVSKDLKGYINKYGNIIWEERKTSENNLDTLDIDFMQDLNFQIKTEDINGEFYSPKNIGELKNIYFKENDLSVVVKSDESAIFNKKYIGYKIYLINNTKNDIKLNTLEGNIFLILQALDKNNEWKDLQNYSYFSIDRDYSEIKLHPKSYADFIAPHFKGEFKTKMRVKLTYQDDKYSWNELKIFSSEFEGWINPAQLWRSPYGKYNYLVDDPYGNHSDYFLWYNY